eukprot:CAMPEP_0177617526 /NCGR_PEP_ID=MMETSP0419_2-20121207/24949_1 /TAXON_ID=582737 /ORGANISM="Tetraselmis sp., Strain GSL018" /LENGTH=125 /DNA_ID=CAMNT_0019116083 /DNA_START=186 /DNA_END=563 /DNA_ORIENTATION=+
MPCLHSARKLIQIPKTRHNALPKHLREALQGREQEVLRPARSVAEHEAVLGHASVEPLEAARHLLAEELRRLSAHTPHLLQERDVQLLIHEARQAHRLGFCLWVVHLRRTQLLVQEHPDRQRLAY